MSFNDIINTLEGVVENEYTFDPMNGMIYDFTKKEDINAFLNGKKSVFVVGITKGVEDINLLESDYNKLIDSGKSPFIGKWGGVYDLVLTFDTDEEASKYDQNIILKIQGTEFVEQEHPRDDDGEFTDKGGDSITLKDFNSKWIKSIDKTGLYKNMVLNSGIDVFDKEYENDKDNITYTELSTLNTGISNMKEFKNWNNLKMKFNKLIEKNESLKNKYEDYKKDVNQYNSQLQDKFKNSKSFYRGSSIDELKSIINHKSSGIWSQYTFTSMSMNESEVKALYNFGLIIEFNGDDVREKGILVNYNPEPTPYLHVNANEDVKDDSIECIDCDYPAFLLEEEEVRVNKEETYNLGIDNITIDIGKQTGYLLETLSHMFGITNYNKEWISRLQNDEDEKVIKNDIKIKLLNELMSIDKLTNITKNIEVKS